MRILNERLSFHAISLALFASLLWGGNSVAIKIAVAGIPPFALAAIRFSLSAAVVVAWVFLARIPLRLETRDKHFLSWLIALFIIQIFLLNAGTERSLGSRSTLFISTYPFFTTLFAHWVIPGDRLSVSKIIGLVFSFLGIALVFGESLLTGNLQYLLGDFMVLCSGILLGARQVYTKLLTQNIHPGTLLFWQAGISIPIFIAFSFIFEHRTSFFLNREITLAVLYQGLAVAGFGFIIWTSLLRRFQASRLGVFAFTVPLFGVYLSNLVLHEAISPVFMLSMVLVGSGIAVVNYEF